MQYQSVDILIIGSGMAGATYARLLSEQSPDSTLLMVDAGPRLTARTGQHTKNIADDAERDAAQVRAQGNFQKPYPLTTVHERAAAARNGTLNIELLARPGVHLVAESVDELGKSGMPAAAMSTNLGGMGAHWTCACPRMGNGEKIPFLTDAELDAYYQKAEELLCVTQAAFPDSPEGMAILKVLGDLFNPVLSPDRQVQPMPLACQTDAAGNRYWTGPDVILGKLAQPDYVGNFSLRSETICRKLLHTNGYITGAIVEYLPTGRQEQIDAKIVIVAADALRTPQLLWASGIRPNALGHYLNEHPFVFSFAQVNEDLIDRSTASAYNPNSRTEPTIGVFWVPFDAPGHPFHGQVMHMDVSPLKIETHGNQSTDLGKHIVGLGWGALKDMRVDDCIVFSETETDFLGMPKMRFRYGLTEQDYANIEQAKLAQAKALAAFGKVIQEGEQTLMPPGSSLHYEGTTRMGLTDDGTSVCDTHSQVWGFDNLFVGGNGVIPVATTSNPTLTSVAMAVRSCERVIEQIADWGFGHIA